MQTNAAYGMALARAFGGALLFSFPPLMTMEMWSLGLSYHAGCEPTFRLRRRPRRRSTASPRDRR